MNLEVLAPKLLLESRRTTEQMALSRNKNVGLQRPTLYPGAIYKCKSQWRLSS